jgi:PEP-CTERM motif
LREPQKQDLAPFRLPTTPPVSPYQQGGRIRSDWVVAFGRNRWPPSVGIGGHFASDSAPSPTTYTFPANINFPGSTNTDLAAINGLGQIVGVYYTGACVGCAPEHGFSYSSGIYTTIDVPGASWGLPGSGTFPFAISNTGQVAGFYYTGNPVLGGSSNPYGLGFLYSNGQYTSVQFPGSAYTALYYINSLGEVAGYSDSGWFLEVDGSFIVLKPPSPSDAFFVTNVVVTGLNDTSVFGYFDVSAVPEPSTWAMLLIGFVGIGFAGYRKRRQYTACPRIVMA